MAERVRARRPSDEEGCEPLLGGGGAARCVRIADTFASRRHATCR